ncbi:uncharacterized protein [Temnothorax nylanderi]|uniref:uncharacterized protein n=1 Tax=Temnothorax nylanderi TaxID=102681 RepID=UPI003A8622B1
MSRTATVASRLHDLENHLGLICDASYVRHQKSNNNAYQRKSYSGQKKTHLCKPFTICTTDGYVVDVAGPFTANKNDAQILEHLMSDPNGLVKILREGDTFILDRGFRDVTSLLEEKGYKVLMPVLKGKRNQLTTAESNQSRLVTKIRWVVEAVHGIIGQKFKLLHHQLHNSILKNAGLYCKIACLLHNLFGKRLNSDSGRLDQIIDRINASKDLENTLAQEVEDNNWNRKTVPFQSLSSTEILDFPEMTIENLKIFFTGSYQLSQAVSYLSEMLEEDNTLRLSYAKEQHDIIRFEVRSRHINSKVYKSYLQYQPDSVGLNGVRRYCCNCANGNRTIGCCSHIAAIVFYLSHARYLSRIIRPAEILTTLFDFEEVTPVIEEDSDEED